MSPTIAKRTLTQVKGMPVKALVEMGLMMEADNPLDVAVKEMIVRELTDRGREAEAQRVEAGK
jgi:hypothetical protein